ncbi:MAG: type II toxin-antitoxin system PemK/MazF family toxin [Actinobacteria bacterium]|nr:type II toxin-antitoxin system PemK/MazF family toxin [Actinomycetota bacterium]
MMRRGEIRFVDLDPALGSEADDVRPAVIVSNNGANAAAERSGSGVLTVVPVTSDVTRVYPFQVLLPAARCGLRRDSKAQAEQVRSVAVVRIGRRVGGLPADLLAQLDGALRLHLDL